MDQDYVRKQFPILSREVNGKPLLFLDSAASAQKPQRVIDRMVDVMQMHYANIHRGVYTLSVEATELVDQARSKVASFIGADNDEVVFVKNTSEAINLVAYSWGRKNLKQSDVVVLSEMEHHSNIVPWQILRDEIGIRLEWIEVDDEGYLRFDEFVSRNIENIKLVCVTHVSNVLGTINPIKEITRWAHGLGSKVLVDGAQGVTNVHVDVKQLDADFYAFSGHKLYGPTGIGVLYGKRDLLNEMPPFLGGGDMILEVHKEKSVFKDAPERFEAGTPPIVEIVGLGEAVDFVTEIGIEEIWKHNQELLAYAMEKLREIEGVKIFGPMNLSDRGGVVSFSVDGVHPHDVATILDGVGVAIRSGHHCAQVLCDRYGVGALCRASLGVYTVQSDIDVLIAGIRKVKEIFQ